MSLSQFFFMLHSFEIEFSNETDWTFKWLFYRVESKLLNLISWILFSKSIHTCDFRWRSIIHSNGDAFTKNFVISISSKHESLWHLLRQKSHKMNDGHEFCKEIKPDEHQIQFISRFEYRWQMKRFKIPWKAHKNNNRSSHHPSSNRARVQFFCSEAHSVFTVPFLLTNPINLEHNTFWYGFAFIWVYNTHHTLLLWTSKSKYWSENHVFEVRNLYRWSWIYSHVDTHQSLRIHLIYDMSFKVCSFDKVWNILVKTTTLFFSH